MIAEGWRLRSAGPWPATKSHALVAESSSVSGEGTSRMGGGTTRSGGARDLLREVYEQLHQPLGGLELRAVAAVLDHLECAVWHRVEHALGAGLEYQQVLPSPHEQHGAADSLEPERVVELRQQPVPRVQGAGRDLAAGHVPG